MSVLPVVLYFLWSTSTAKAQVRRDEHTSLASIRYQAFPAGATCSDKQRKCSVVHIESPSGRISPSPRCHMPQHAAARWPQETPDENPAWANVFAPRAHPHVARPALGQQCASSRNSRTSATCGWGSANITLSCIAVSHSALIPMKQYVHTYACIMSCCTYLVRA